jgi:hypothetical protein
MALNALRASGSATLAKYQRLDMADHSFGFDHRIADNIEHENRPF